jgi:two-component system, cell cycle sensor histidine kinase and response regulator CckA
VKHGEQRIAAAVTRPARWRFIAGPVATALIAIVIELLSRTLPMGNPEVLYLVAVVSSVYLGGIASGVVSALIAMAMALVVFSLPGPLFRYTEHDAASLVTLLVAIPAVIVMVGVLKRRDERRMRESVRMETLEQYREIVEELDAIVWERDPETHRVTFVSRRAEEVLGYPLGDWLEDPEFWVRRLHPEDKDRVLADCREAALRDRPEVLEYRMETAAGRFVWLREAMRVLTDGRGRRRVRSVVVEITDRRRAEEALRVSEAHKAAILASALDAIVGMDANGRVTEFNPAAEKLFGFRREELLGREMAEHLIPVQWRERHRSGLARYVETGEGAVLGRRMEFAGLRADGTEFPLELTIIEVARDRTPAFTGFLRDITVRKQAEHALRESERQYRLLMEEASDGILITDLDANFLDVNPKGCEILGYTREELLGLNIRALFSREDLEQRPLRLGDLRAWRPVLVERVAYRKDGTPIPVEISAKRLDDHRLVGIYRDISERKRGEIELRNALSTLEATLESTADGILVVDHTGKITQYNQRFVQMWGIPADIVASREDDKAIAFVLDQLRDPRGFISKVRELYANPVNESFDVLEFKDGRVFERYSKPQLVSGEFAGRVWSFRDVTESHRATHALRQSEEQLRQAQKMEAIGRLAGGVAHDFNNLLTAILGNASLMVEQIPRDDPQHQLALEIQRAAERAAGLTRQLLAFSRKQLLEMKVVDLNAVVSDMQNMLDRLIGEQIELIVSAAPGLGRVRADPGQIEQVIMNLVVNARDAMPEGGKLIVETQNVDVDKAFAEQHQPLHPGRYVMFAVSDTGVGMDPETQAHIFEPFYTTKERGRGTGLGLSTVYGIVRQSDGAVWVYSTPRKGSTFKIYLPRVDDAATGDEPQRATPATRRGSETVLLVEDEVVVRTLVRNTLVQQGYQVLEAENGAQALRIAQAHRGPLQLLVTDVIMPGMSGRELAENLLRRRTDLHVLYISGYTDETIAQHGVLAPGVGFLQKPFTLGALVRKVRETIEAPPARAPGN